MRISDWSSDVCSSDLRQEDHPCLLQLLAKGGRDRNAVEHRVDRDLARALDPGEHLLLLDRDAELFVNPQYLWIDLFQPGQRRLHIGRRIIMGLLITEERRGGKGWVITCRSRWS